jgi:hypothetical protein
VEFRVVLEILLLRKSRANTGKGLSTVALSLDSTYAEARACRPPPMVPKTILRRESLPCAIESEVDVGAIFGIRVTLGGAIC